VQQTDTRFAAPLLTLSSIYFTFRAIKIHNLRERCDYLSSTSARRIAPPDLFLSLCQMTSRMAPSLSLRMVARFLFLHARTVYPIPIIPVCYEIPFLRTFVLPENVLSRQKPLP